MKRRAVITGMGTVNPVGKSVEEFRDSIFSGRCGIGPITAFDTTDFRVKLAAEVKDFDPTIRMTKKEARRAERFVQFARAASAEAWEDCGLETLRDTEAFDADRIGVIIGCGIGGLECIERETRRLTEQGPERVSPLFIPSAILNMAAADTAIALGLKGPVFSTVTACASSTDALGEALLRIQTGECDVVLAGGTEATVTPLGIAGFQNLQALTVCDDPSRASIPFDRERSGFVMGEGAGILVVEEMEHALKRGATIYAELAGYGQTCDAYHMTTPDETSEGIAKAVKKALAMADCVPEDVDYINAHGTSTKYNDVLETKGYRMVFGDHADALSLSSTKSMTGHLLGATGAVEAIACILAIGEQCVPPTVNLQETDEECDLDYTPRKAKDRRVRVALSSSLGFGGHNGVLVFREPEEK